MATLKQAQTRLAVQTQGAGFTDITDKVRRWLDQTGVEDGLLTAFIRHTSASLVIQENADRDVQHDLVDALDRLAPQGAGYRHAMEGPDDMPAHIQDNADVDISCNPCPEWKNGFGNMAGAIRRRTQVGCASARGRSAFCRLSQPSRLSVKAGVCLLQERLRSFNRNRRISRS